jgi:hypothetical protein
MEDTLKVDFNEETGEVTLDWDPEDPKWSFLNDLTEEEIGDMVIKSLKEAIARDSNDETV